MPAKLFNTRWEPEPDDFAATVSERDLAGFTTKNIVIEEGTTGLLLVQGRFDRRLEPGPHQLEGGLGAVFVGRERKVVVLVTLSDVMLFITLPRLLTRDPVPFGVQTAITLRFTPGREAIFLNNLMSGKESLTSHDLRSLVYPEINEAAQIWSGGHTIKELADDLSLRDELALALENHIRPVLDRNGLTFGRMEVREFKCEIWDKSVNMRVETYLQVTQEQAELQGRKRLFDLVVETDLQDLAEETQKVATYEKRIQLWQRMQRAANQEQMDKISSEEDLVGFMRQIDRDRLLKDDEFDRFKVTLRETGEDHEDVPAGDASAGREPGG